MIFPGGSGARPSAGAGAPRMTMRGTWGGEGRGIDRESREERGRSHHEFLTTRDVTLSTQTTRDVTLSTQTTRDVTLSTQTTRDVTLSTSFTHQSESD